MHNIVMSKIRCHSCNKVNATTRANINCLNYIATREGVDYTPLEEELMDIKNESSNERYLKYINERPRSHGLFGNYDFSSIEAVSEEIKNISERKLPVFRGILSLCEEDARELGYFDKKNWKILLESKMPDIAKQFRIDIQNLRWVAAFHYEKEHPHVHYMFWDASDKIRSSFIPVAWQNKCREEFSGYIFKEEHDRMVQMKNLKRDLVIKLGMDTLKEINIEPTNYHIMDKVRNKDINQIANMISDLCKELPSKGRVSYKVLDANLKRKVDSIVDNIYAIPEVKKEVEAYQEYMEKQYATYSPTEKTMEYKLQKEFEREMQKRTANQVLSVCKELLKEHSKIEYENKSFEQKNNISKSEHNRAFYDSYKIIRAAAEGFMKAKSRHEQGQKKDDMAKKQKLAEAKRQGKINYQEER